MVIALFGKTIKDDGFQYLQELITKLELINSELLIYEPFYHLLKVKVVFIAKVKTFNGYEQLVNNAEILLSIGGDGTILDTITFVRNSGIPILGINMGRLGFLASINKEKIIPAIDKLIRKEYLLDRRTLLSLKTEENLFGDLNYALNELFIYRKLPHSMLTISVYVEDRLLNSYWSDGLIVATPTGSTAYSMSCGGPIITPDSDNFVITPIAPHNLSVRPVVIPDKNKIKIKVEGRDKEFFVGLDSRSQIVDSSVELLIEKEDFKINLVQMTNENFFSTIRDKLMWGLDKRN